MSDFLQELTKECEARGWDAPEKIENGLYLVWTGVDLGEKYVIASVYKETIQRDSTGKKESASVKVTPKKVSDVELYAEAYGAIPVLGFFVKDELGGALDLVLVTLYAYTELGEDRVGRGRVFSKTKSGNYYNHSHFGSLAAKAYQDYLVTAIRYSTTDAPDKRLYPAPAKN